MSELSGGRSEQEISAGSVGVIESSSAYDLQAIRFRYQSRESDASRWILDDVSFAVGAGKFWVSSAPMGQAKPHY